MMRTFLLIVATLAIAVQAKEIPTTAPIQSLALFKNGLAVVKRSVSITEGGTYRIDDVPEPVHGTFSIDSPIAISTRVTMRETDAPARSSSAMDFQQQLVGKDVTIAFNQEKMLPVSGRVVAMEKPRGDEAWNRTYQANNYYWDYRYGQPPPNQGRYLVLDRHEGRSYIDMNLIAQLTLNTPDVNVKQRVPVLLLTAQNAPKEPAAVSISYLTKGIAWAPSYRVNLEDSKTLSIQQDAVIKNELGDFSDADVTLVSGFP